MPKVVKAVDAQGNSVAGFSKKDLDTLIKFRIAAKANQKVVVDLNQLVSDITNERNEIVGVAKLEERKSNFLAEKWAQSENELKDEKTDHTIDVWGYRILLILMGVISIHN